MEKQDRNRKREEPIFYIGVAARITKCHPHTLRLYEQMGLVKPLRKGGKRVYSLQDIARIKVIRTLTQEFGVNLAGVEIILNLMNKLREMEQELEKATEIIEEGEEE
jgi:MerR family transcriptional regulator/heat shock protein HspR